MTSPSKAKGSGFERSLAKYLTDLYGSNFIRNISGSGAYVGGKNTIRKATLSESQIRHSKGDIVPPDNFPLFNAEAKFYAKFEFHQLFDGSKQLEDWLQQLITAGDKDDLNILFFKINRRGQFVAVQSMHPWDTSCNVMHYNSNILGKWTIFSFDNFFRLNTDIVKYLSIKSNSAPEPNSV